MPEIERVVRRFEALAREVSLEAPWKAPDAERLDAVSFQAWLVRRSETSLPAGG